MFFSFKEYGLLGFRKSTRKGKQYDAILYNKKNNKKVVFVPFGSTTNSNFRDITGLNLYPHLINNDPKKRKAFRARMSTFLKKGFYSPAFFSLKFLW